MSPSPENDDTSSQVGSSCRLDAESLSRLEDFIGSLGVSPVEALTQLVLAEREGSTRPSAGIRVLSPKQSEVMECLKAGLSVKETAARLCVTEATVRTHILRIRSRLDCTDLLALRFQ